MSQRKVKLWNKSQKNRKIAVGGPELLGSYLEEQVYPVIQAQIISWVASKSHTHSPSLVLLSSEMVTGALKELSNVTACITVSFDLLVYCLSHLKLTLDELFVLP